MTPKEKAKELVYKFYDEIKYMERAKQCALIAVYEIQKLPNIGYNHNRDESQYDYWEEVKQEIIGGEQ